MPLFSLLVLWVALLQACATGSPMPGAAPADERQQNITALELSIRSLGDDIDPHEARRAARIAIDYSQQLAREYEVASPPLVHNVLVNLGIKSRGLCKDWTRDLLVRLRREDFDSLEFNWAIANYEKAFLVEHSTVIVSARGDSIEQGVVLDGWRNGGELFWTPTLEDSEYRWHPAKEIFALKKQAEDEARNTIRIR